jgi:hypothetical protein
MIRQALLAGLTATLCLPLAADAQQAAPAKSDDAEEFRRLREDEFDRVVNTLTACCKKMEEMQLVVLRQHVALAKTLVGRPPNREQKQMMSRLCGKQGQIVAELTAVTQMLEKEGAAVAFPEVFEPVRRDAILVQCRLKMGYLDDNTAAIAQDIVDTFQEMTKALNRA